MRGIGEVQAYGVALLGVLALAVSVLLDREQMYRDLRDLRQADAAATLLSAASRPEGPPAPVRAAAHLADAHADFTSLATRAQARQTTVGYFSVRFRPADANPQLATVTLGECRHGRRPLGVFEVQHQEDHEGSLIGLNRLHSTAGNGRDCAGEGTLELRTRPTGNAWRSDGEALTHLDNVAVRQSLPVSEDGQIDQEPLRRRYISQIAQVPILNIAPSFRVASLLISAVSLALGLIFLFAVNRELRADLTDLEPVPRTVVRSEARLEDWISLIEGHFWKWLAIGLLLVPAATTIAVALLYSHERVWTWPRVVVALAVPVAIALGVIGVLRLARGDPWQSVRFEPAPAPAREDAPST